MPFPLNVKIPCVSFMGVRPPGGERSWQTGCDDDRSIPDGDVDEDAVVVLPQLL
ncbi:MAG: hypothetical protein ACJ70S_06865 [Nitrososphaera sp.]